MGKGVKQGVKSAGFCNSCNFTCLSNSNFQHLDLLSSVAKVSDVDITHCYKFCIVQLEVGCSTVSKV